MKRVAFLLAVLLFIPMFALADGGGSQGCDGIKCGKLCCHLVQR